MTDLARKNFETFERMGHIYIAGRSGVKVNVQVSRNTGSPTAIVEGIGGKIALHSIFSPQKEAIKWVESKELRVGLTKALVYGFGFGYHIEALMDAHPEMKLYIVDATPEVFAAVAAERDLSSILSSPMVSLLIGPPDDICLMFNDLVGALSECHNESALFIHKPSVDILPPEADWLKYALEMQLISDSVSRKDSVFVSMTKRNEEANVEASENSRSVSEVYGMFAEWPMVVAATGPSLDYSVRVMSRAISLPPVVALDSSLKPLMEAGIRPDFVVTGDPQERVAKMFEGVDLEGIRLVFFKTSCPGAVAMFPPERRYFAKKLKLVKGGIYDPKMGELFFSGTVFSAAVDFAVRCGARPVIIVGADFSFTQSRTHATGGSDSQKIVPRYGRLTTTKGLDGGMVTTSQIFHIYLRDFEEYCSALAHKTDFINCTAQGAEIKGLPHLNLADVLIKYRLEKNQ